MRGIFYFAYGRNINKDIIKERGIKSEDDFNGYLRGYELVFTKPKKDGTAAATIKKVYYKKYIVEGVVYRLFSKEELAKLDKIERGYRKEKVDVYIKFLNKEIEAITYVARENDYRLRPSMEYLEDIINGARDRGLYRTLEIAEGLKNINIFKERR